ncbi:hypothetical protein GYMLUDRAFT_834213 [Collybiopsis luxurians FD-317 M1]|uniref:CENP-V/GFA domain-containing protein n=1 Tax=Collybiopsis luxurians FD-317 M1 TaxID=944289 RepID=A0A0D0C056_9AGAR|nr:hypothetical protein GYMLUDRAFT_834213 [Collybiopsis luxurians FD-317 M1]
MRYFSGEKDLQGYSFGTKRAVHQFCPKCGSSIGSYSLDPEIFPGIKAINVRMLNGIDLSKLEIITAVNGRAVGPEYEVGKWHEVLDSE